MTLTQHGPKCDFCENFILPIGDEMINIIGSAHFNKDLHACNECNDIVMNMPAGWYLNFKLLPDGPVRQAYEDNFNSLFKAAA